MIIFVTVIIILVYSEEKTVHIIDFQPHKNLEEEEGSSLCFDEAEVTDMNGEKKFASG